MKNKLLAIITLVLGLFQLLTILVSWLIAATFPTYRVRSLLGSEGIRWFLGQFTTNLASPLLVWIILIGMAWGVCRLSGLYKSVVHWSQNEYRQRFALKLVLIEIIVFAIIIGLLTLMPQAILLGITGELFPSSFSQSIVPVLCFICCTVSITFGVMSGTFHSLTDIFKVLSLGISELASWLVVYVVAAQLYYSVLFVLLLK